MSKEKINNKSAKDKIWLIVSCIFTILGFFCCIFAIKPESGTFMYRQVALIDMFALITFYTIFDYNKPHSNLLRWLFIVFDVALLFVLNDVISVAVTNQSTLAQINTIIHVVLMLGVAFVSGRLNKIEQNKIIMIVIGVLLASSLAITLVLLSDLSFIEVFSYCSPLAMWIVLCTAYFGRYKEHIEAGK